MKSAIITPFQGQGAAALLCKSGNKHKFDYGSALVVSGGAGRSGAARLAARAALRVGAGLVTLGAPRASFAEIAARISSELLLPMDTAAELAQCLCDARINAVCIGPGLEPDRAGPLVAAVVRAKHAPYLLLDAGALSGLAQLGQARPSLSANCILTPHGGEFARLFPDLVLADLSLAERAAAVQSASVTMNCTVLLKGAITLVAAPSGAVRSISGEHLRHSAWLATAGSGDVLSGVITGLLARGAAPMLAGCLGAWLHLLCAEKLGPGLISDDLPESIPMVLRDLCAPL